MKTKLFLLLYSFKLCMYRQPSNTVQSSENQHSSILIIKYEYFSCTNVKISVRINLFLLPIFPPLSHSIAVFFFPVGLSSLMQHSQQVLWVLKSLLSPVSKLNSNCQLPKTEEILTPYNTCWKCCVNDERPTGKKNTTVEWDNGWKNR